MAADTHNPTPRFTVTRDTVDSSLPVAQFENWS